MNRKLRRLLSGILVVIMFITICEKSNKFNSVEAYQQMADNTFACCDQRNHRVLVYKYYENNEKFSKIKTYNIPVSAEVQNEATYVKAYSPTDAKLRKHPSGKTILLVTTGTTLYIFDCSNNSLLRQYTFSKKDFGDNINVHSVDMSPKGYVYVADPNSGKVVRYKLNDKFEVTNPTKKINLPDAHSVLYDFEKSCLWAAGGNKVVKLLPDGKGSVCVTVTTKLLNNEKFAYGHCLIQNPKNSNELYLSGNTGAVIVDKREFDKNKSKSFKVLSYYYGIKGMVYHNNRIFFVRHEAENGDAIPSGNINDTNYKYYEWTTRNLRYDKDGKQIYKRFPDNVRVYKIIPYTTAY